MSDHCKCDLLISLGVDIGRKPKITSKLRAKLEVPFLFFTGVSRKTHQIRGISFSSSSHGTAGYRDEYYTWACVHLAECHAPDSRAPSRHCPPESPLVLE
jgi:hypothetical protein